VPNRRPERFRGERAVTIIMTSLLLVPLMVFAAFGVDLAGFYSRVSQLQRAADAAALAGTVWMPDFTKATDVAADSLERNGFVHGVDGIVVDYAPGDLPNSLAVTIEDTSVTTYFSDVIGHRQAIARSAEAQYNLPLPLGSPLNYFGGDSTRTAPAPVFEVTWPIPYDDEGDWPPSGPGGNCNVGTAQSQGLGGWRGGDYRSGDWNQSGGGTPRCLWSAKVSGGTPVLSTTPPAGHFLVTAPDAVPCEIDFGSGNSYWGRFEANGSWNVSSSDPSSGYPNCEWGGSTSPPNPLPTNYECNVIIGGTFYGRYNSSGQWRKTIDSARPDCTWQVGTTGAVTDVSTIPTFSRTQAPANPHCNVGAEATHGQWVTSAGWTTGVTAGRPLCQWPALVVDATPPNPISPTRSPGFWAMIEGPQTVSPNGDAYNTRCYINNNCSNVQNLQYKPESDENRGFWYIVRAPSTPLSRIQINVFDASYNASGDTDELAGDRSLGDSNVFPTRFRVFEQDNPLDFGDRDALGPDSPNQDIGSCHWELGGQSSFRGAWQELCTIDNPTPGGLYQINVQTRGASGNGVNGYAVEAVSCGTDGACFGSSAADQTAAQPALYAYSSMGMQNNNTCSGSGCTPPPATFYLAEVGPQYAGKSLVLELWDPGDATGNASLFPKAPSASLPKPVVDVPAADCSYTSRVLPNAQQSSSAGGATGRIETSPQDSDFSSRCGIRTTISSNRQFNGVWLTIRVEIPSDYTCEESTAANPVNPEVDPNSCWWGIEYNFSSSANDVTTWQARIEGNPVHLTE
jgi:hypothetical protein